MALVKYGVAVSELSGKVGGVIFANSGRGSYCKKFTQPVNPRTVDQLNSRGTIFQLSQFWKDLDVDQRAGWNNLAAEYPVYNRLGEPIYISGNALYIKCNFYIYLYTSATIDDAPPDLNVDAPDTTGSTLTAATKNVSLAGAVAAVPANYKLVVRMTPIVPISLNYYFNKLRIALVSATAAAYPISFTWPDRFGVPGVGDNVWVYVQHLNLLNGMLSNPWAWQDAWV